MPNKQISELFDMHVYSEQAVYIGKVEDVVLDVTNKKVSGLALTEINKKAIDTKNFTGLLIPYRIVKAVEDIVIVRHLPQMFKQEPVFGD